MSRTILELSISLDGYAAGPNIGPESVMGDNGERLHDWLFAGATETGRRIQGEFFAGAGAVIVGRTMFDLGKRYWDPDPETFQRLPVFVVTHRPADPIVDPGGSTFTFVSEGLEHALVSAREAAGDRDVVVLGGPTIAGQFLSAGLLDELRLHLVHILLGAGTPLFDPRRSGFQQLEATRIDEDSGVTHYRFSPSPTMHAS
jgi:dihydrofolate reductase